MSDAVPDRYVAYPRPADRSAERLKALRDAYYGNAWIPWLCALIFGSVLFPLALYMYVTIGVLSVMSFVMTYRAFRRLAFAKSWSRTSPGVAAFVASMNVASYAALRALVFAPAEVTALLLVEFLVVGGALIVVPNSIIKREVRRYGLRIRAFQRDDFDRAVEEWSPASAAVAPSSDPPGRP